LFGPLNKKAEGPEDRPIQGPVDFYGPQHLSNKILVSDDKMVGPEN
jgi:hypothetical protein